VNYCACTVPPREVRGAVRYELPKVHLFFKLALTPSALLDKAGVLALLIAER
jgi:hypothetical protein